MAWLERDPSGNYHVRFRLGPKKFRRSLKTSAEREAVGLVTRLEENIRLVERGRLSIPPGADMATFLLSDGKLAEKLAPRPTVTLKQLFDAFFEKLPPGHIEQSTISGMRIHERHLIRHIGASFPLTDLNLSVLQDYVEKRSKEKGRRGKKVTATTIKRPIVTFCSVWNWGVQHGYVEGPFPHKGLKYPKGKEKPPFQTWAEIERQTQGLSVAEAAPLWECVFLTLAEIDEILKHVKEHARHPFLYPMFAFAAHTGARRAEMLRSQLSDLDFGAKTITIHERKKAHDRTTFRTVPMSPFLEAVLAEWKNNHPSGLFTFGLEEKLPRSRKTRDQPAAVSRDEVNDHFKRTLAGSKWAKLRGWHVFRHSFCSNCAARGVDQRLINGWVGHQTDEMVRRYRHLIPNQQQEAIRLVFGANTRTLQQTTA
ncbi:MAG: site-specific integrase [Planctomycetes bacterium]|nr:site-specific integrase [Planctomycetota bacterium]